MSGFPGMKTFVVSVQRKKREPFIEVFKTRAFDKAQAKKKALVADAIPEPVFKVKVYEASNS